MSSVIRMMVGRWWRFVGSRSYGCGVAVVGDLVRSTSGGWMRLAPTHCPAGHEFVPGRMIVGYRPCTAHSGHRTWACPCGAEVAFPELGAGCDAQGPGRAVQL